MSIRQPYAELILRGVKTIEYRSRRTRLIGETFYIYASKKRGQVSVANGQNGDALTLPLSQGERELPTGVIVGTAIITKCQRNHAGYEWHLSNVKRLPKPRKPKRMPQPVWFRPF
ncbi:MAG: ASCH domain-containing protein [Phycisphaerales bacterium]|nr:ASCH domain-containing protein [Phycisphaerales bacterium]